MRKHLPPSRIAGFTLAETIIATAVGLILLLLVGGISVNAVDFIKFSRTKQSITERYNELLMQLQDEENLKMRVRAHPAMECFWRRPSWPILSCPVNSGEFDPGLPYVATAATPSLGLTLFGEICNSFSAATPTDDCPLQLRVTWETFCQNVVEFPGECFHPEVRFQVVADFKPNDPNLINKYNFGKLNSSLTVSYPRPHLVDITSYGRGACVHMSDTTVWCWGANQEGLLGRGDYAHDGTPQPVMASNTEPLKDVVKVKEGTSTRCVIQAVEVSPGVIKNKLRCWGENDLGQYGVGSYTPCTTGVCARLTGDGSGFGPVLAHTLYADGPFTKMPNGIDDMVDVDDIYPGENHMCAKANGNVYCWGGGGMGPFVIAANPNLTPGTFLAGGTMNFGDPVNGYSAVINYYTLFVGLPTLLADGGTSTFPANWKKFVSGGDIACVILGANNELNCWGQNTRGSLGFDAPANYEPNANARVAEIGQTNFPYGTVTTQLQNVVDVKSRGQTTCAVLANGQVPCWGARSSVIGNGIGMLGDGDTTSTGYRAEPGYVMTSAGVPLTDVVQVDVSWYNSCALKTNGDIYCWGGNTTGQLGTGDFVERGFATKVTGLPGAATKVSVGVNSTCAVMKNSQVYCWGDNSRGDLGRGTLGAPSPIPARVLL